MLKVLGKCKKSYVKNFETGELGVSRKISVCEPFDVDKEADPEAVFFGDDARTITVSQAKFDEVFDAAAQGDIIVIGEKANENGRVTINQIVIIKKDGKMISSK